MLNTLRGHVAIGHCRYSTSGSSVWENAQPTFRATPSASLALGHNGNLTNTLELAAQLARQGGGLASRATSDTDVLTSLFAVSRLEADGDGTPFAAGDGSHPGIEAAALAALPLVPGCVLARLHGRADAVRGPRSAGLPAAGPRAAGERLDGRQRDVCRWTSSARPSCARSSPAR